LTCAFRLRSNDVFLNYPFENAYKSILKRLSSRSTMWGLSHAGPSKATMPVSRLTRIQYLIEQSRFGIHDISSVEIDPNMQLPRFKMPMQTEQFFGCKRFGQPLQRKKTRLILDKETSGTATPSLTLPVRISMCTTVSLRRPSSKCATT
jgi:hypothetical protein